MCGRFGYTNTDKEKIMKRFRLRDIKFDLVPRYNIAPGQDVPVILNKKAGELVPVRWGLVPFWAKEEKIGYRLINARSETVFEKPSFRHPIKDKRCLILADFFYEWKKEGKGKRPYCIRLRSGEPFTFAGLWDIWKKGGKSLHSCTIITAPAPEAVSGIHDRMPVILSEDEEAGWLGELSAKEVRDMLKPFDASKLDVYEISDLVNSPENDSPEILSHK